MNDVNPRDAAAAEYALADVFVFRLPFLLPIAADRVHLFDGHAFTDPEEEHPRCPPMVGLRVVHTLCTANEPSAFDATTAEVVEGLLHHPIPEDWRRAAVASRGFTWVEAITPARSFRDDGHHHPYLARLQRCLVHLNELVSGYRVIRQDSNLPDVTLETLGPFVIWQTLDTRNSSRSAPRKKLLRKDTLAVLDELSDREENFLWANVRAQHNGHPFTPYRRWFDRANYALTRAGDLTAAVNSLQTSFETLLWGLYRSLQVDGGRRRAEIELNSKRRQSFATLVRTTLPKMLSTTWSTDDDQSAVGRYWCHLYKLRCRIVHAGYMPTTEEANLAFRASDEFMDYLTDVLGRNRMRFPRTALALLGEPGVKRRGYLDAPFLEVIAKISAEEKDFWLPVDQR